jgi:AcrR family transcriptional regulator
MPAIRHSPTSATPLERALRDHGAQRPTVLGAFAAARVRFHRGERLDMQGLAEELGINRVTLYRWVGSREQLYTEVLWDATCKSFARYRDEAPDRDSSPTATALSAFVRDVNAHAGMRRLLADEPSLALTLLTSTSGQYQHRYMQLVQDLVDADVAAGHIRSDIPPEDLAYTAVRITEAYIHTRMILGEAPDARRAERVLRVLLR